MPVAFRYESYRFFFYSNEGEPREPLHVHVHVRSGEGDAKFWLKPNVHLADSTGYDARALRELTKVVTDNADLIERTWNEHFA